MQVIYSHGDTDQHGGTAKKNDKKNFSVSSVNPWLKTITRLKVVVA